MAVSSGAQGVGLGQTYLAHLAVVLLVVRGVVHDLGSIHGTYAGNRGGPRHHQMQIPEPAGDATEHAGTQGHHPTALSTIRAKGPLQGITLWPTARHSHPLLGRHDQGTTQQWRGQARVSRQRPGGGTSA